ncbi:ABC transporter permease [Granulicella sibirica]|nr:ABC transporter permease subunit [Granulicella sibirica]
MSRNRSGFGDISYPRAETRPRPSRSCSECRSRNRAWSGPHHHGGQASNTGSARGNPCLLPHLCRRDHRPRSADRRLVEFFRASGAGRWKRLLYLDAVSALPALLSGMKLAVTTAMIGAVVGEWFGAPTGLGIVILNTMQNFQIPLMWAAVLVVAAISLTGYGVIGLVEQVVDRRRS